MHFRCVAGIPLRFSSPVEARTGSRGTFVLLGGLRWLRGFRDLTPGGALATSVLAHVTRGSSFPTEVSSDVPVSPRAELHGGTCLSRATLIERLFHGAQGPAPEGSPWPVVSCSAISSKTTVFGVSLPACLPQSASQPPSSKGTMSPVAKPANTFHVLLPISYVNHPLSSSPLSCWTLQSWNPTLFFGYPGSSSLALRYS